MIFVSSAVNRLVSLYSPAPVASETQAIDDLQRLVAHAAAARGNLSSRWAGTMFPRGIRCDLCAVDTGTRLARAEDNVAAYSLAKMGRLEEAVATVEGGRALGLDEALARDSAELESIMDEKLLKVDLVVADLSTSNKEAILISSRPTS